MVQEDYFPKTESQQAVWCVNFAEKIVIHGLTLGKTALECDVCRLRCF